MKNKGKLHDQASALVVQKHQLSVAEGQVGSINYTLDLLMSNAGLENENLDNLTALAKSAIQYQFIELHIDEEDANLTEIVATSTSYTEVEMLSNIDCIDFNKDISFDDLIKEFNQYSQRNQINIKNDPFTDLMTPTQRISLEKRIQDDFSLKKARCDIHDYMIAATCGLVGGLIDIFFVGLPGQGYLTQVADDITDSAIQKFAKFNGWTGPREGSDPTASAIGFLERNFKINYDQAHTESVDGLFKMSTKNHHIKSLGHSPDLVGLFFSILDQFNSTAHFVSDGQLVSIETETFDLRGSNFVSKIFCGFYNWLGHLFSDMGGSSGASGRGSGIPIPFYSLLQFINLGEFGQHRQKFSTIAVRVFQEGYDMRHGLAMAMPVLITELLTRLIWMTKQRLFHQQPWMECIPSASNAELRRMLLVAHGSLCLVDTADATVRSGGNIINFMLRCNIIGWARFGTLALKEINSWYNQKSIDADAVDAYLEADYQRMIVHKHHLNPQ